ncbi:Pleckstrin homology domain-containing protein [Glomus cerebriforme]|uniref:Pleckstrin homology domain-containing protein n=1 Tax=Glomus cerebriforme TaxID=658196 RepID=A0A397T2F1_9GLOM|nr:Pleckstrin homology domain-containing protein [Glomus cerebriforme]
MTEVTTSQPKEDNITTTPVELEKKSDDANNDTKPEVTPTQPEGEASTETKPEEELKPIETGYLHKSSKILMVRHWSKSYFYFGSEAISLPNLRNYYKKNVKKAPVPPVTTKTANAVNATSTSQTAPETTEATGTEPSKVDEPNVATSSKVEETKEPEDKKIETKEPEPEPEIKEVTEDKGTPAEDKKQTEDKKPETKEEEHEHNASHQIYTNIAHASQTGEGLLFYSKSESDKNLPHGIINLKEVTDVTPINDASARQFSFKIVTSYRTFELFAEKSDERDRWIKTIKEKAAKAQEARETSVETSEGFKDTYDKLVKGTAFTGESKPGELSDDVLSGDDEQQEKPRSADKRKSFLPFVQFGRKTSTAETSHTPTITESTQEDGSKVTTTTESPKVTTTEETEEAKGEEPKSPQKSSKFNFNYFFSSKKPEKEKSKDETHKEGEHSEGKYRFFRVIFNYLNVYLHAYCT